MVLLNEIDLFNENGIIKIKGFLNQSEVDETIKKINPFTKSKNDHNSYFANNFKKNLLKLFNFQYSKFLSSNYLINIAKKKNMQQFADLAFGKKKKTDVELFDELVIMKNEYYDLDIDPENLDQVK